MCRFHIGCIPSAVKQGLLTGVICALLVLGLKAIGRLDAVERGTLDTMFQMRGQRYPSPQIIILVADDATVVRFGQWPLPRSVYADVVRRLQHAGAKTIAFDVLFTREGATDVKGDKKLIKACREAKNVVHAAVFAPELNPLANTPLPSSATSLPSRFAVLNHGAICRNTVTGAGAIPALLESSAGLGHVNVFPEWDGALRRIPHLVQYRGIRSYPSLALATTAHFLDVIPDQIIAERSAEGGEIRLNGRRIPLDANGETIVNWVGSNGSIPTYSINQLFNGQVTADVLKDRIVLIGVTATGAYEHHATPFSPNQPAVELQANAIDDILSNRLLHEASPLPQLLLLFAFSCLVGVLAAERNAKKSAFLLIIVCGILWGVGVLFLSFVNLYLPLAAPLLSAVLTTGAVVGQRQARDASELKRTLIGLQAAEERYALAERGANDGLWDWSLQNEKIYFSPRWKSILGYAHDEIGSSVQEWFNAVHTKDIATVEIELRRHLEGELPHFECEFRMVHKDGGDRWVLCRGLCVRDKQGKPVRIAGSLTDITDRKLAELNLLHNAFHDALTGLPNRALFMNRLEQVIACSKRNPNYFYAVVYFDIDNFKTVNDSLGHSCGDLLLISVAQRMENLLRPGDTVARQGGDEFTLLLNDLPAIDDAMEVIERLQERMAEPFELNGNTVFATLSVGVTLNSIQYEHPEDVLRDADTAMYRAKALGAGQHKIFNVEMHQQAVTLLRLQTELRIAIEQQNFQAHYQPIVDLQTGRIAGFEALVRWRHPERGLLSPDEFIPVAEDTGLIIAIDRWILGEACRQTHIWHQQFPARSSAGESPLTISVNLSSKHFTQTDLVEQVANALRESEMDSRYLKLEITEGAVMKNADTAAALLRRLKSLGLQLSIDDFGTGYSSLSYLHRFPLDILKIDRSFVNRLDATSKNAQVVQTIITLARNLEMEVIAEGIESAEQLAQLRELGCNYGQGYFFSKPLESGAAAVLIEQHPHW